MDRQRSFFFCNVLESFFLVLTFFLLQLPYKHHWKIDWINTDISNHLTQMAQKYKGLITDLKYNMVK